MNLLAVLFGLFLVVLGIVIIKFGERRVDNNDRKGSFILKLFSMGHVRVKLIKWAIGILSIWFGLSLVLKGMY